MVAKASPQDAVFSARVVEASPTLPRRAFLIATGLRFVGHLVRLAGALVGLRTWAQVALGPAGVEVRSRTDLMGVKLRERQDVYPIAGIAAVGRDAYSGAGLVIVGLVGLAALVLFGASTAFYGLIGRSGSLLGFAISIITLGVIGDVLLFYLAALRRRQGLERVRLAADGRRLVLAAVPRRDAEAFVRGVAERLGGGRKNSSDDAAA